MRHRSCYVLALTLVATTVCADRLFASDQPVRLETRQPAEKLVARLTRSFRQVVPHTALVVQREIAAPLPAPVVSISTGRSFNLPLSTLQLPLPPPAK